MNSNRGRGHSSYRGGYGRNQGNPMIPSSPSSKANESFPIPGHPLYEEFKQFLKSKEVPNMAKLLTDGETIDDIYDYKESSKKDNILILEEKDIILYFENNENPWFLMTRYLNTATYAGFSYKNRSYYENILTSTGSAEFSHFTSGSNTYNFSKAIIKKIILPEEWGLSTLTEREFIIPPSKNPMKCTYWDYIESFHKAFLYENPQRKHTWFFKVCEKVYNRNRDIPNWFTNWWSSYGPNIDILPEDPFRNLYGKWLPVSPRYEKHLTHHLGEKGVISSLHFFMEFSIPWIWKWSPHVDYTPQKFPTLQRMYHTKWWPKMLQKNPATGLIHAQETIDHIINQTQKYQDLKNFSSTASSSSANPTKEQMIQEFKEYCSKLKEGLQRFKTEEEESSSNEQNSDAMSVENQYQCLAGESQPEEESFPVDYMIDMIQEAITRKNLPEDKKSSSQ